MKVQPFSSLTVARRLAAALLPLVMVAPVSAQVLESPSVEQLIGALTVPEQFTKSFRRTVPPDANNLCAGEQASTSGLGKNIVVVPYHPNPSARVDIPLQFGNTSDALDATDKRTLDKVAQAMKSSELQTARFALAGHTSSTGTRELNLELSCARALAVRRYLVSRGVEPERLSAYGFGPDKFLPGRPGEDAANRRVEINRQ